MFPIIYKTPSESGHSLGISCFSCSEFSMWKGHLVCTNRKILNILNDPEITCLQNCNQSIADKLLCLNIYLLFERGQVELVGAVENKLAQVGLTDPPDGVHVSTGAVVLSHVAAQTTNKRISLRR